MTTLRGSVKAKPNLVAGVLAGVLREEGKAETLTFGTSAPNRAAKATAIARGFVNPVEST